MLRHIWSYWLFEFFHRKRFIIAGYALHALHRFPGWQWRLIRRRCIRQHRQLLFTLTPCASIDSSNRPTISDWGNSISLGLALPSQASEVLKKRPRYRLPHFLARMRRVCRHYWWPGWRLLQYSYVLSWVICCHGYHWDGHKTQVSALSEHVLWWQFESDSV